MNWTQVHSQPPGTMGSILSVQNLRCENLKLTRRGYVVHSASEKQLLSASLKSMFGEQETKLQTSLEMGFM